MADASAFATAVDFVPMAIGLIAASVLTGPWVARHGPRVPMTIGCILAAGGIFATSVVLGPHVDLSTLGWVLPIAGIGFGIMLVPVTSVPLTVVRPERSGMAASATNTSREMGAVFGVAILGAIVNAQLTGQLASRLKAIGIPPNFQTLVMRAVTGGGLGGSGAANSAEHDKNETVARIATKVVHAAYEAFGSGLHIALVLSACLLLAAAAARRVGGAAVVGHPDLSRPGRTRPRLSPAGPGRLPARAGRGRSGPMRAGRGYGRPRRVATGTASRSSSTSSRPSPVRADRSSSTLAPPPREPVGEHHPGAGPGRPHGEPTGPDESVGQAGHHGHQ